MYRFVISVIAAVLLGGCSTQRGSKGRQPVLALPYWQFDQTPAGWRSYADRKEFRQAGVLIEAYFPGHPALVGADGTRTNGIIASIPTRNPASLAHLLADKTERFLKVPVAGSARDRETEAARFHREYLLLLHHGDSIGAVHALDAAMALAPDEEPWQREMVLLLPNAAVEILDPGGQNWAR